MNNGSEIPQLSPKPTSVDTPTVQPYKCSIDQFSNQISASSEETLDVN